MLLAYANDSVTGTTMFDHGMQLCEIQFTCVLAAKLESRRKTSADSWSSDMFEHWSKYLATSVDDLTGDLTFLTTSMTSIVVDYLETAWERLHSLNSRIYGILGLDLGEAFRQPG